MTSSDTMMIKISCDKIEAAMEIMPSAALVMNKSGHIIAANTNALKLFGYGADELIGQEIEILVPERFRGKHVHHRVDFFKDARPRSMGAGRDLAGRRQNGSEFPIEIGLKPFDTGHETVVMATIVDISERKKMEELLTRQQEDLMELSTPVIQLWHGILVLPVVGTLDSERSRIMMEQLLNSLSETGSTVAIIDISGVCAVDTMVAQHLLKTIEAAKLMGAECLISGIRPEIANTIVSLGIDLSKVKTKSTMERALHDAFTIRGLKVIDNNKVEDGAS